MTPMKLVINRYNQTTPSVITKTGSFVSTPWYINPTTDTKKAVLNEFRRIKTRQLIEMGHDDSPRVEGNISVVTNVAPPMTPVEQELGINEESLRMMLFGRQGINEKLVIQLQNLTGVEMVSKEEALECFSLWLDYLFEGNEDNGTAEPPTKTNKRTKAS